MGDGKTLTLLQGVAESRAHHDRTCRYGGMAVEVHFNPSDADRLGIEEGEDLCGLRAIRDAKVRLATIRVYCDVELGGQGEPLEQAAHVPTWTPTVPARPVEAPLVAEAGHVTVGVVLAAAFFVGAIAATIDGATTLSDWLIFAATVIVWRWIRRWAIIAGHENDEAAEHRRAAEDARGHARAFLAEAEGLTDMPSASQRMPRDGEVEDAMGVLDARMQAAGMKHHDVVGWDEIDMTTSDLLTRADQRFGAKMGCEGYAQALDKYKAHHLIASAYVGGLELGVLVERLRWQPHLAGDREVQP